MKAKSVSMQKLKEVLRLNYETGLSQRHIAARLSNSYIQVSLEGGGCGPGTALPVERTDAELQVILRPMRA